jgi:hypothetical protein
MDQQKLLNDLDYMASKCPPSTLYGEKNIFLGEFGAPENALGGEVQHLAQAKLQLETALQWGVHYVIYWELYCNEPIGVSHQDRHDWWETATNENMKGFWLIKPDGSKSVVYHYFKELFNA